MRIADRRLRRRVGMSGYRFDRLKVLVIDDNPHMRRLVVTVLQAFGTVHLFEAPDAERGWALMNELNPDVIVLDWMLPGMNGLEFAERVRTAADSPNPFVPIIMLTGHTQVEHVRLARDAGITEFLAKPVSVNGLYTRLVAVIEHPRPFVRTKVYFGPCRRRRNQDDYHGPERRAAAEPQLAKAS